VPFGGAALSVRYTIRGSGSVRNFPSEEKCPKGEVLTYEAFCPKLLRRSGHTGALTGEADMTDHTAAARVARARVRHFLAALRARDAVRALLG
jgi:hypothetical protein